MNNSVRTLLKAKYGSNKKTRNLYNCAIRNEVVGGDKTLDLLELFHQIRRQPQNSDKRELLNALHKKVEVIRDEYVDLINQKYSMKSWTDEIQQKSIDEGIPRFFFAINSSEGNEDGTFFFFCREPAILFRGNGTEKIVSVETYSEPPSDINEFESLMRETGESLIKWYRDYVENC